MISSRDIIDADTVWVVSSLPRYTDREEIRRNLRPDAMIYINSTLGRCIDQPLTDTELHDKELQPKTIHKWHEDFTEPPL